MSSKISRERKIIYYIGLGLIILGGILFISSFLVNIEPSFSFEPTDILKRPIIGIICMIIGSVLMNVGSKGLAGSGVILSPEKARDDLKPFNIAKGEMINDELENIDIIKSLQYNSNPKGTNEIIKIKCRYCGALNDEDAKFCKECGRNM